MDRVRTEILVVQIGIDRYGLDRRQTSGSMAGEAMEPLRRAPNGVAGTLNLEAGTIPVFDLHWRLGHPVPLRTSRCVIVLLSTIAAGLLVTAVEGIERAEITHGGLLLAFGRLGYVRGIVPLESGPLPLLEPLALVPEAARKAAVS